MKAEFEAILRKHGHNVYLQRRRFADEVGPYREVDGGRYNTTIEKWTVWRWFRNASQSNENQRFRAQGFVDGIDAIFYFQAAALPKTGDLVSEETPHELEARTTYRIEHSVPFYDGDRLIYFAAHVKRLHPIS